MDHKRNDPAGRFRHLLPALKSAAARHSTLWMLSVSGLTGFLFGALLFPSYHVAVETGQVLAGLIPYPPDNPFYIYHLKAWSLLCQLSALLLKAGCSEKTIALILSGLLGMILFQAICFAVFAVCRRTAISFAAPFFVFCSQFYGCGVSYPVIGLGYYDSFGSFGLYTSILTIGLIGSARFGAGGFLLGLLPCIHGAYGIWMAAVLGVAALLDKRLRSRLLRRSALPFCAGAVLTALSFAWQRLQFRHIPALTDPDAAKEILFAFIRNFDYHRRPFEYFSMGVLFAFLSAVLGGVLLLRIGRRDSRRVLPLFLLTAFVLVLPAAGISHLDPQHVPVFLLMLMPGRFINISTALLVPLLLGSLSRQSKRSSAGTALIALIIGMPGLVLLSETGTLSLLFGSLNVMHVRVTLLTVMTAAAGLLILQPRRTTTAGKNRNRIYAAAAITLIGLICLQPIKLLFRKIPATRQEMRQQLAYPLFRTAAQRNGVLLTSSNMRLIQLLTRRPILLDADSVDGLAYAPESAVPFERIMREIYGVDLFKKPAPGVTVLGGIPPTYDILWNRRTPAEWQQIRKNYGVTDVLTVAGSRLQLPVVARTGQFILYTIPSAP